MKKRLDPCPHCKPETRPVVQQVRLNGWRVFCPRCNEGPREGSFRRRDAETGWSAYVRERKHGQ